MDSKKLEILVTAADLGSFTRASEVVGYTQSGLTHMMDALEKEIGFPLLQRSHSGIQLTDQGNNVKRIQNAVRNQAGFVFEIHVGSQFFQDFHQFVHHK